MDFAFSEEQQEVRDLAERIFTDRATHDRLKELETHAEPEGPFDRELWAELADAGLIGIALKEDVGGSGLDFVAACLVAEATGRSAAYVPFVETALYGAAVIDRFGTESQRQLLLPGVASGQTVLTAAMAELVGDLVLSGGQTPATTATKQTDGSWILNGTKACVPAGLVADFALIPASLVEASGSSIGVGVFVIDTTDDGLTRVRQDTTTGRPEAIYELRNIALSDDDRLGGDGADGSAIVTFISEHASVGLCVQEAGACAAALALTAEYAKTREQFGKVIATFQAVGQRAADAYVDTEAIRLTAWHAAWRLSEGLDASAEVAVAKFWAAEGGQRVVHAASHLHGGVGVDRDYPLHRYFLLTRQIELSLGNASDSLRRLGAELAAEPV